MPLYRTFSVITVERNGRRVKIKPTGRDGQPVELTAAEAASVEAAGVRLDAYRTPAAPTLVEGPAPAPMAKDEKPDGDDKKAVRRSRKDDSEVTSGKADLDGDDI